jgi:hypothetical protein
MKYSIFLFFIMANCFNATCQPNYFDYHKRIIKAEEQLLDSNYTAAFDTYSGVFKDYDFVFARDCIIAAEFAYSERKKTLALEYLSKAFQMGVMPTHLQYCPIFQKNSTDTGFFRAARRIYTLGRKKYLARIDKVVLIELLEIKWNDQLYKNTMTPYTLYSGGIVKMDSLMTTNLNRTIKLIKAKGIFPGQYNIGILHNGILKELGIDSPKSLLERYKNLPPHNSYIVIEGQFDIDKGLENISSDIGMGALYHQPCAIAKIGKATLMACIKNGSLHPNDYAVLYAIQNLGGLCHTDGISHEKINASLCPNKEKFNGGYGVNETSFEKDKAQINLNRKEIGLPSLEHWQKLYYMAQDMGIVIKFGYMEWK